MPPAPLPDWSAIDTVLLDMDGTILDLKFDHHFWLELVPTKFAAQNALTVDAAKARLMPLFAAKQGTLEWYSIDHWSRELDLDLPALNRESREPFDRTRTLFVDDSLPVLRAARAFGIAWIYAIAHPDSTRPRCEMEEFPAVNAVHELA